MDSECRICSKKFDSLIALAKHQIKHCVLKLDRLEITSIVHDQIRKKSFEPIDGELRQKSKRGFICSVCNEKFTDLADYEFHCLKHLPRYGNLKCTQCQRSFYSKTNLKTHLQRHFNIKTRCCGFCDKKFITQYHLDNHVKTHTKEKPHECEICNKRFGRREHLVEHLQTHKTEKTFKCPECDKCYKTKGYLYLHNKLKHKNVPKSYVCSFCPKAYYSQFDLSQHIRHHTTERPYNCYQCGKQYISKQTRSRHIVQAHTDNRPYKCEECDANFAIKSQFTVHMKKKHGNSEKVKCPFCFQLLSNQSTLRSHLSSIHTQEKAYNCSKCEKAFPHMRGLKQHLASARHATNVQFPCKYLGCDKICMTKSGINVHYKIIHLAIKPLKKLKK